MTAVQAIPGAVFWGTIIWYTCVERWWPWDWRGKRKHITIKPRNRDFR